MNNIKLLEVSKNTYENIAKENNLKLRWEDLTEEYRAFFIKSVEFLKDHEVRYKEIKL